MRRSRSAHSDFSDADAEALAEKEQEQELARCVRKLKIMENDRRAYHIEAEDLMRRQQSEIDNLQFEKKELEKDLRLINSTSNKAKDGNTVESLSGLGSTKLSLQDQIQQEKEKQDELDAQMREMRRKIDDQRKNTGTKSQKEKASETKRKSTRMESILQLANKKFSSGLEKNKELREELENLRQGRKRVDEIYRKLDKELQQIKQEMSQAIDQSSQAYEARDEARAKIVQLKEKAEKDLLQHNAEMKEHIRVIDQDQKLRSFMGTKCREREEDPQLVEWRQRKEELEAERKNATQTDSVETYEEAFERIRRVAGAEDTDTLVKRFIECEDTNFALFNFVNEQNNELELLSEQIQQIRDDIENFKTQGVKLETERQHILEELEEKKRKISEEADAYDDKFFKVQEVLDRLREGVGSLFEKIQCDRSIMDDLLGSNEEVTEKNVLQYLGIIEERTNQILYIQAYVRSRKDQDDYLKRQTTLLGEGPQPMPKIPPVLPPSMGDDYDSDTSDAPEDAGRPLTRNELESRVLKSVVKRESLARKAGLKYEVTDTKEKSKKKEKEGKH